MDIKTFDDSEAIIVDDLCQRQKENVSKMRTAMLSFSGDGGVSPRQAIQGITSMRIYHQMLRIIRYTELMDKLEMKLYDSIEYSIDHSNTGDPDTMYMLLAVQEKLQKSMIESHKLLQPYLDIQEFTVIDLTESEPESVSATQIMNPEDRDKLRSKAQAVLQQLQLKDGESDE